MDQLKDFENLETGDEIHLTSGEIWRCVESHCGPVQLGVYLVKGPFNGSDTIYNTADERLLATTVKEIFRDAIKGGAKIVKGIGIVHA